MKKKILLSISVLAVLVFSISQASISKAGGPGEKQSAIHWYSLEEAQRLSDSIPRKIFVDFSTSWCGWCKRMDAETFSNPIIAKYMNEHYYCVKFDAETHDTVTFNGQKFFNRGPEGQRSAHDFAITVLQGRLSYPSYAFISKDRLKFTILPGYMPANQFEPYLHYYAEEKENVVTYEEYLKTFVSELPKKEAPPKPIGPPQY
jgi:thioredoxin-related protein